ncbi:MAG TPA: dihydrofolate reductase, partial [Caulobacteraceae bacterium]
MAKFVFGMIQSLDGYVDGVSGELKDIPPPGPKLFRHFCEWVGGLSGSLYGRRIYELMRYWDEEQPEWDDPEREFAVGWRNQPKWVVSRTL